MQGELMHTKKTKIHLGCGRKILEEYVNIDICENPGVDVVCDINNGIPFRDNSFIEALAVDFIEHINPANSIYFMNEVYRILQPGGIFKVHVPEAPGITAYQDPTHSCFWNEESFYYYVDGHPRRENYGVYYGIYAKFELIYIRRKHHMWKKFFNTLNVNYLFNYVLDLELKVIK